MPIVDYKPQPSHDQVMALLFEQAQTQKALAEEVRLLKEQVAEYMSTGPRDEPVPFELIAVGQFVRMGDEWPQVVGKSTETTLEGEQRQILSLRADQYSHTWRYEATDGETFYVEEPF